MVEVRAFCGWRYDVSQVGSLSDVTAPPYDVITPEQQSELYEQHPCNVVRLILNRDEPGDESPDVRYRRAAEFLNSWINEGILKQERDNVLYVYHQEFAWEGKTYVRKGFLAQLRQEEFGQGKVFPHEQTLAGPKADRLMLAKACRMNLSPVFGLYPDSDNAVQDPLEEAIQGVPPHEATDPLGVIHRLWPVADHAAVGAVIERMRDKPIFIADGHHRYETGLNYRRWLQEQGKYAGEDDAANFILMMFVGMSDPGLAILPTHRLVSGFAGLTSDQLQSVLESHFEVESMGSGEKGAAETWGMIDADGGQDVLGLGTAADGNWLFVRLKDRAAMSTLVPEQSEEWRELGVSILHKLVLEHLLAAKFPGSTAECRYVHQLQEVTSALGQKSCDLACLVPPADISHVEMIASNFETMPPKSTYFHPKLLSGLVFSSLE